MGQFRDQTAWWFNGFWIFTKTIEEAKRCLELKAFWNE
jgi:hypothetical protein